MAAARYLLGEGDFVLFLSPSPGKSRALQWKFPSLHQLFCLHRLETACLAFQPDTRAGLPNSSCHGSSPSTFCLPQTASPHPQIFHYQLEILLSIRWYHAGSVSGVSWRSVPLLAEDRIGPLIPHSRRWEGLGQGESLLA